MKYGLVFPFSYDKKVYRAYADARTLAELAHGAEESGWDGVFVWDAIFGDDPWVTLAAIAMRTERVRIGPIVTALSRRRPWK